MPSAGDSARGGSPLRRPPPATLRLFVALWPDPAARRSLLDWRSGWQWPASARPVPAPRLHLTLHFLGPVARPRLAGLRDALAGAAAGFVPFELRLGRAALWPGGLAVLTPRGDDAGARALQALHARLGGVLKGLGLSIEDRPLRPHVTLARGAAGALPPAADADLGWQVQGYALVQSAAGYRTLLRCG